MIWPRMKPRVSIGPVEDQPRAPKGLARANPTRSLILLAIGAVLGLLIAGFGLFTAKGTAMRGLPPEDVALVNQRPILRSDFVTQTEGFYGMPFAETTKAQRKQIISDMIREELFVQRGLELDLAASDPDVRQALVQGVERQVEADVTAQHPSDDQLRAWYQAHVGDYSSEGRMTVHDLVTPPGPAAAGKAARASDMLRHGASLDAVAKATGLADSKKTNGEEFYFAAKIHLGDKLFAAAKALKGGQASDPIVDASGVHVLWMEKNTPPVPLTFEEAREKLTQDYLKAAQARIEKSDEKYLRRKADIEIAPEYR